MFHTITRSIAGHKWRLVSTSLAIILGVAFVAGTYILTDTLGAAFDEVFGTVTEGVDLTVQGETPEFSEGFAEAAGQPVPPELVDQVAAVDGVRYVEADAVGFAQLIDEDGQPVGGMGPPTFGFNAPTDPELSDLTVREGRLPTEVGEVALDAGTASSQDIAVGDQVPIVLDGPVGTFEVVGLVGIGELDNFAGATFVVFERELAFEQFAADGFASLSVVADEDTDVAALQAEVAAVVGGEYEVLTAGELTESITAEIDEGLGFFTTALLVFAGVALFVGSFLIANTFSIIVAQRTRELALLRAVGASRRQVLTSVLAEALVVGLFGSGVGLLLGIGVARGLHALLDAFGISLPAGALVIRPFTILVSFLVGTGITILAAMTPAVRSLRVPPIAALQAVAAPPPPRYGNLRYIAGFVVFGGGVALLVSGLFAGGGIAVVGAGAVVTLLGAAFLAPLVTRPLLRLVGAPVSASRGVQGQLATENALRNPRRTAATASALMIGLAMVAFISILGASVNRSAEVSIDNVFLSEFQVNPSNAFGMPGQGFSPEIADQLSALDEVAVATPIYFGQFRPEPGGATGFVGAFDPGEIEQTLDIIYEEGSGEQLAQGGVAVSDSVAGSRGLSVGDTVTVEFAATGEQELTVQGIYDGASLDSEWALDEATYRDNFADPAIASMYVKLAEGADAQAVRPQLEQVLAPFPTVQLQDLDEVKQDIREAINGLLGLVTALLLLSVIIALFGIVNTLGLSVFERTRELGLLRAVGANRGQVRSMIRWESVLIALLGTVFGLVIGVLFAWMVVQALSDEGISQFVVPYAQLVLGAVLAALAGVLAAIIPARRASRIDILRSLEAM